jgi:transposase
MLEQLDVFQTIYGMKLKIFLPDEKPENTMGRPIVPYRKVLDGIIFVLRTGCQWKMLPKEAVLI